MSELNKTIAFVAAAAALSFAAAVASWPRGTTPRDFREQGEAFFPDFKDARAATELEVIDYDEDTAEARDFKVMLKDGKWVIPSHHDYPADAKDRLARTAAGVIDLKKDVIVSDRPDDYAKLGVVDPLAKVSEGLKGRGKRVSLKDKSGRVLADFIIGKEVPGRPGQRYVRVPGGSQARVYGVNVKAELSTRFEDWIETNLLKLQAADLRRIIIDNHKVDPEQGTVKQGDVLTLERKDAAAPWSLEGAEVPPGREMNTTALGDMTAALADLKIVGVRPKPAGFTATLKGAEGSGIKLSREAQLSLAAHGFYLTRDGRILSNYGDVIPSTQDGILYTLRFGEVTFATGEELSAGAAEAEAAAGSKDGSASAEKKPDAVESRYLFVTANFDPRLVPEPRPAPPDMVDGLPADVFAMPAKEREQSTKAAKERAERERTEYDRKVAEGKKKAKELSDRFAAWYYVVPGTAFRKIVLDREALTRPIPEKPAPGSVPGPAGLPGDVGAPPFSFPQ